jgi:hypothetical protein
MSDDNLAAMEDAAAAFLLNLVAGMKEIHVLATERYVDGQQLSQVERMERIEAISAKAIRGDAKPECAFAILEHGHNLQCILDRGHVAT